MKISIIGLGAMGQGLARQLIDRGHTPIVWNRSPEPVEKLAGEGAIAANNVGKALSADIIFFVLYDDGAVRDVILKAESLKAIRKGAILVGTSTISIDLAKELETTMHNVGADYVAMLMFGRPDKARAGELHLPIGGAPKPVKKAMPIMELLGTPWLMGDDPLAAHSAKLAGNYLIACSIATIGESAAIAASTGAHPGKFLEMITQTLVNTPLAKFHAGPIIKDDPPDDKAGLDIVLKDVNLGLQQAKKIGMSLPVAQSVSDRFADSQDAGFGDKSAYGIYKLSHGDPDHDKASNVDLNLNLDLDLKLGLD